MSYAFGRRSRERLETCDQRIQRILGRAITFSPMDFTIVCGARFEDAQNEAFATGASKKRWPGSKHNKDLAGNLAGSKEFTGSMACDVAPWNPEEGIDWRDSLAFARLQGVIDTVAKQLEIPIRWGGDWDRDGQSNDQSFMDIGHFELV